jgi:hypothetical protein
MKSVTFCNRIILSLSLSLIIAFVPAAAAPKGEIVKFGNKWGWSGTNEAFVPQLVMAPFDLRELDSAAEIRAFNREYLDGHGFNGISIQVFCQWYEIGERQCSQVGSRTPDQRTFEALKLIIRETHNAGGMVHIWLWGDNSRQENPNSGGLGGLNGGPARAVYDRIGTELGSLPGWSMGYGYDLDEWVTANELRSWRNYMHERIDRNIFFGGRSEGPNSDGNHARENGWHRGLDYVGYEHHRPSYNVYVDSLRANPNRPVMSEDRFRVRNEGRSKDYSPEQVRQGLWISTMAGGVANIWGYLMQGGGNYEGTRPFPNKNQLKTYGQFFENRFKKDFERCQNITGGNQYCLKSANNQRFVFYAPNTNSVRMNLSSASGNLRAIAVDAKANYREIDLGALRPENQTWTAPSRSDWAIAVGDFGAGGGNGGAANPPPNNNQNANAPRACHRITRAQDVPNTPHFAPPFNLFSNARDVFMRVTCSANGAELRVGSTNPAIYTYNVGYVLRNSNWNRIDYQGATVGGSDVWLSGEGTVNITDAPADANTYFLAYSCQWMANESQWKCGCRDTACATNHWQLQSFQP